MLTCPNDGTALTAIRVEDVPVDQCPVCGGYWLQRGELEMIGEQHHAHLKPIMVGDIGVVNSQRKCPQDSNPLREHEFVEHTGIKIDQCPSCQGIWLDKAELAAILNYLDDGSHNEPTLSQRAILFLYQLTAHPPII
jgi:Zn-finger nucleic acid-binding protein